MPIPDTSIAITMPAHDAAGVAISESVTLSQPNQPAIQIRLVGTTLPAAAAAPLPANEPKSTYASLSPLASVHFQLQSTHPLDDPQPALSAVPFVGCYLVVGHADPSGPERYIGPLSLERASYVAGVLRSSGSRAVKVAGAGSTGTTPDRGEWPNDRRADVFAESCTTPADAPDRQVNSPASKAGN